MTMPMQALLEQHKVALDLTPILTNAFDAAWTKFKASGSALAKEGCAPSTRALLAKRMIETAEKGETDIDRLIEDGLKYLAELK
jgi:hypothetical protein